MAKQVFTTGQVLTAAQMIALQLNDYNQTVSAKTTSYVLVAADAGTTITMNAAGATTITVNTGLFAAGDTLKVTNIGAGVMTLTAGTATVSTSGLLTLAQYASGTLYFTSTGVSIFNGSAAAASSTVTFVGCKAYNSAAQTIANTTSTAYLMDTETFDTDAIHSTSSNTSRFTIPAGKAGYWKITCNLVWAGGAANTIEVWFTKNGTAQKFDMVHVGSASGGYTRNASETILCSVADYLEVWVWQNTGGNLNIAGGATNSSGAQVEFMGA